MSKRLFRKRLSVDIPTDLHQALTDVAKQRGVTLTKYVINALVRYSLHTTTYEDTNHKFDRYR